MKFAKLSLVAAVAVAGFTTANAQPLEQAIKDVDVSGSVVYRYNDYSDDKATGTAATDAGQKYDRSNNNYKIGLNVSSKVNDDVKFNSRFLVADMANAAAFAPLDSSSSGDANVNTQLSQANFAYTGLKNTTVTVGKQGLNTPYTTGAMIDENEQNGTGAMVLSAVGPVTLGAAYFNQTNLGTSGDTLQGLNSKSTSTTDVKNGSTTVGSFTTTTTNDDFGNKDVSALAVIANLGPVTADAWYLKLDNVFDTYTVGAKSDLTLGGIALGATARYASLTLEDNVAAAVRGDKKYTDNDIIKLGLTAKAGIFNASVDYAKTGKDGGLTALDSDATTALKGWNVNSVDKFDADYYKLVAGVDILANLNLSANYGDLQSKSSATSSANDLEFEELYGQLTYKMSKNLTTYVRYGTYTKETTAKTTGETTKDIDATVGRLQVAYTF